MTSGNNGCRTLIISSLINNEGKEGIVVNIYTIVLPISLGDL